MGPSAFGISLQVCLSHTHTRARAYPQTRRMLLCSTVVPPTLLALILVLRFTFVAGSRSHSGQVVVKLHGHRKKVECLAFNKDNSMLVSGGDDTDIIVWDIVSRQGRFRLRGHKDAVTACAFLAGDKRLISASKDTLLKVGH